MRGKALRIILAGTIGGVTMNAAMALTFRLIGFGWNGNGILLDPSIQSKKLIAVWTEIEPLPKVVSNPLTVALGLIFFGIIHAFIYNWLSRSWPPGVLARGLRMTLLIFLLSFLFWEFFTPYNMFGEPFILVLLELAFWGVIAISESFTIAAIMERKG